MRELERRVIASLEAENLELKRQRDRLLSAVENVVCSNPKRYPDLGLLARRTRGLAALEAKP